LWEAGAGRELARIGGLDNSISAVPVFLRNEVALRLHLTLRELVNGEWQESAAKEIRTYDFSYGPSRVVLRSSWRSKDLTCLTPAGQMVTFTRVPLPEQDRWTANDGETGRIEWAFDSARFNDRVLTAFTPDGRIIAAALGNTTVSCRELETGRELFRYTSESPLRTLALSGDGRALVAVCESGVVELHSLVTGRRAPLSISGFPGHNLGIHFAFSTDGELLAATERSSSGGAAPVSVWDVETGKCLKQYPGHRDRDAELLFTADGHSLVVASGPTIRSWALGEDSEPTKLAGHSDEAWALAFAPYGELLASGSDDDDPETIKLWDSINGRLVRGWNAGVGTTAGLAFSPNGHILASAHLDKENNVRLWDVATGKHLATLAGHTAAARSVAFHPDGELLASAGSDKTIRIWNIADRSSFALSGHDDTIQQLAFAPDGSQLASASSDGTVRLWDLAQRRIVRTLTGPAKFSSVAFSPDGRTLAAADEDGSITLWNATTGEQRGLLQNEDRVLRALAFSPDSRILASAGKTGPIRLWDVLMALEVHTLPDYNGYVHSLAFSPNGSALAYSTHDGTVGVCRTDLASDRARRGAQELEEGEPGRSSRRKPTLEQRARTGSQGPL
jgi:WD40 repeat protein